MITSENATIENVMARIEEIHELQRRLIWDMRRKEFGWWDHAVMVVERAVSELPDLFDRMRRFES